MEICTKLINLKELYLDDNNLREIPVSIGNLLQLQILSVVSNKLEILPYSIGKLSLLHKLSVEGNPGIKALCICFAYI